MLKIEYDLLSYVLEHQDCTWVEVLNAFDPKSSCNSTDALLKCLCQEGLLIHTPPSKKPPEVRVHIPPQAIRALAQYEQQCKNTEEERKRRKKELAFNAAISVVSALAGGAISIVSVLIAG